MSNQKSSEIIPSSYRDPSGFLYQRDHELLRQINHSYQKDYDHLMSSKLFDKLIEDGLLVAHQEVGSDKAYNENAYKVIKPEKIPFISYPYEWCFSQLKDAALTTLRIQKRALEFDMSLKDSSAYNIQFLNGKPILIDTLSFEKYKEGQPWVAYKQFCEHFLGPLVLMSYKDCRLNLLLKVYLDGIPLDLTSALLPLNSKWKLSVLTHIVLHARSQRAFADKAVDTKKSKMGRQSFLGLIDHLESTVRRLKSPSDKTEWGEYYEETNYSEEAFKNKKEIVSEFLEKMNPGSVWDVGGNVGIFSRIASEKNVQTVSFDYDPAAVEKNYLDSIAKEEKAILPLLFDLINPSPGIGWRNEERVSVIDRGPADMVFALALIHHLAISNNLPLSKIAGFFHDICQSMIIEFVPKEDSQVKKLLTTREDIFPNYTQTHFEKEFEEYFQIEDKKPVNGSHRTLYLMVKSK